MNFDAVYDVYRGGLKIAKMKRILTINGIENSLYSETKTTGIVSLFRKDKIIEKKYLGIIEREISPQIL